MQNEEVQPPQTLREYLKSSTEVFEVFRWIFRELLTPVSKKWLWKMFLAFSIIVIAQGLQPGAIGYVFNGLPARDGSSVIWGIGVFFLCLIIQKIAQRFQDKAREWIVKTHWHKLDDRVTELFFEKSLAQHVHEGNALSSSTIDKGRGKILEMQRTLFFEGIPVILQIAVSWLFLFILNWISGTIMAVVLVLYFGFSLFINSKVAEYCIPLDRDWRRLGRRRIERWDNVERVKVTDKETAETVEMSEVFSEIMVRDRKFWFYYIDLILVRSIINSVGLGAVIALGAWLVWSHQLNLGLFYPLCAWAFRLSDNIWRLSDVEHELNWNLSAVSSMIKVISMPPSIIDAPDAIVLDHTHPHHIRFEDVSHSYPDKAKLSEEEEEAMPAISHITFDIKAGEKVALLGSSGAGKSTVMKKLLRFDDPTKGAILIDGIDLRNITQASWKRGIGYIPQQAQILDGTIRYNLTYGLTDEEKKSVTDEKLWELMRLLKIDFGKRLTNGLETVVGKRGMKLSGGQAQRLMIGAAVIKRPWLLVVDEATSSLDSTTEKQVHEGLRVALSETETSALIVAHRLDTVRQICTKFIILKDVANLKNGDSQIEAIGSSFKELYEISPTFRRLADDQGIIV